MSVYESDEPGSPAVVIAANFVAEPVEESLSFWLSELGIGAHVSFAPYNQVFQELLDPAGQVAANVEGVNVVLARLEDWARSGEEQQPLERNLRDFERALITAAERSRAPLMLFLCPSSPQNGGENRAATYNAAETQLASGLAGSGIVVVTTEELMTLYPVPEYYDAHGDKAAHLPYKPKFFTALGTMIARKIAAIRTARPKVIVLDCDRTLWDGLCGEDGTSGVRIGPAQRRFHDLLIRRQDAGMLLCVCSRNNEEDVLEVFERRAEMGLKREHIAGWRINWNPKSQNIRSLAEEFNLGLDSFVFLDDSPIECAEVQANCPGVMTFRLPADADEIARFAEHLWILDPLNGTAEGKKRTALYRQKAERDALLRETLSFEEFLDNLGLTVETATLKPKDLARAAELTLRTNQFNFTAIRRSEAEIRNLCRPGGAECFIVRVRDRFGDYGIVGLIIFTTAPGALITDTFLLSCRALGRGVEHRMLAQLGNIALERGLGLVEMRYRQTAKNGPALNFLSSIGAACKEPVDDGFRFVIPAQSAADVKFVPDAGWAAVSAGNSAVDSSPVAGAVANADLWSLIAEEMIDVEDIHSRVSAQRRALPKSSTPFAAPTAPIEQKVAEIYSEVLGVDQVGVHDNFFEMGGHSLLAMRVLSRVRETFQVEIPLGVLFTTDFTIADIAQAIGRPDRQHATPERVEEILQGLDELSDRQIEEILAPPATPDPEQTAD